MDNMSQQVAARKPQLAAPGNSPTTGYLPARHVRERYRVTDMTIWRWLRDEELGFPAPVYLARRRYWRLSDLLAWEAAQATKGEAA